MRFFQHIASVLTRPFHAAFPSCSRAIGLVCCPLAAFVLAGAPSSHARPQQAPNSRVVIDLPEDYVPAPRFAGFQNDATGVSFVILEAPAKAFDEMKDGFTADNLAKKGIVDVTRGELARTDTHVFMRARQPSPAGVYAKFILLFKGGGQTVLVSVNAPEAAIKDGRVKVADIEAALASTSTATAQTRRELYRIGYAGPFKQAGTPTGTTTVFTLDGKLTPAEKDKDKARAALIIAPSLDKRPVPDAASAAKNLIGTLAGYKELKVTNERDVKISGLQGVSLDATARDADSGETVVLRQVLLVGGGGGYYRMIAIAPEKDAERLMPEFSKMMESFTLVK